VIQPVVVAETVRRHFTSIAYCSFLAFLIIVSLGVSRFNHPAAAWPSLVALLAIVVGCKPIGPEFSSGTLQLILVKPVKRWVYLLSRVAGVVSVVWIAAGIAGTCELVGRLAWGEVLAPDAIGAAIVNCFADAILTASLLVLLGSLTRAYFNVAIYLGVELAFNAGQPILGMIRQSDTALGRVLTTHPVIELTLARIDASLFPDFPPGLDGRWLTLVLGEAAVALVLAAIAFQRRDVPYGAD
jgi:ABC-type transport system involved in multi-copper enzyme maturation permease subunit